MAPKAAAILSRFEESKLSSWITTYLTSVRLMVAEAERSPDARVQSAALRILERQAATIRDLELENWRAVLVPRDRAKS